MSWQPIPGPSRTPGLMWVEDGQGDPNTYDQAQEDRQAAAIGNQVYGNDSRFQKLTPQENAEYMRTQNLWGMMPGGFQGITQAGHDLYWSNVPTAPQHNDTGGNPFSAEALITGGLTNPYSEQGQTSWNDARYGGAILSLPFLAAGGAALAGGAGAGAAGAGAAEGGAATGVDASTGLFAGESATSGAAGAGAAGSAGSTSLIGGAGSDTLGGSSMEGLDPSLIEDPSYWNPEGGTTGLADPGASGINVPSATYGSTDYMQAAQDMAKQLGITPATALKYLLTAGGAALGAAKGGAKPAGTTTTTQDLPDWLKAYAQQNVAQGSNILSNLPSSAPLLSASQNEAMKTINGDYLNPNSNPYFASSVNDALGLAKSQYAGMYGGQAGSNINNSGFQEGLTRTLGQLATNAYSQNYQNERGRQATAAFGAPQFASQSAAAPFAGNQAFQGLFPNVSSTSVPYFSNPLGSAFSGALGGYALGGGLGK